MLTGSWPGAAGLDGGFGGVGRGGTSISRAADGDSRGNLAIAQPGVGSQFAGGMLVAAYQRGEFSAASDVAEPVEHVLSFSEDGLPQLLAPGGAGYAVHPELRYNDG